MTTHRLKLHEDYFEAVKHGIKTFEIRKNDRNFKVGDVLDLMLYRRTGKKTVFDEDIMQVYQEDHFKAVVTYILTHEEFPIGIPEGYVCMAIRVV